MSKNMYQAIGEQWKNKELLKQKLIGWRRQHTVERIDRPTRLDRARALGYKAKEGYIMSRVKVGKGARRRRAYRRKGRKPSKYGLVKFRPKSLQWIAEDKAQRRFVNLVVLNSYFAGEDGTHKYFEVVLVDPNHPVIINDPKINWICKEANRRRAFHGMTAAGKRARGLK
jgi:large subunit ribosomal protein L15e